MTPTAESATSGSHIVTGLFKDRESVERGYQALLDHGYDKDDISVLMSDETHDRYRRLDSPPDAASDDKMIEGAGVGAAIGGTSGALLAAIAAIGPSVVLPGVGLIVAGPLVAALAGAGAGAVTGGLLGALIGLGIPEANAQVFERRLREGGIVLVVKTRSQADAKRIEKEWREYGNECEYC
jgi:hypothetical protein